MSTYLGEFNSDEVGTLKVGHTLYGTCSTAANTVQKDVTLDSFDKLIVGVSITVKFTNSNTVSNPALKVGSTVAKTIKMYGTVAPGVTEGTSWPAGSVVSFTYDGTYWVIDNVRSIVEANPSGTASSELTKLRIGDSIYSLPDGVNVVANPQQTGTIDLTSIQIDQTVYNIPQGGGGSGATIINATLYSNQWNSGQQTISDSSITTSSTIIIGLANSANQNERQQAKDGALDVSAVSAGSITVTAYGVVPSISLPITLILF